VRYRGIDERRIERSFVSGIYGLTLVLGAARVRDIGLFPSHHRVARPHCWGPALSEPDVRLSYSSGSSPSTASFRETRFRYGKMLAVNPVAALWMKQDAVICTRGTTHQTRDAIVNAPAGDPGDLGVAHGAEPALELPEKAKSPRTPKCSRHIVSFAFFEVGFMGRIVGIGGALDLDVPLNGRATGEQ
jgi:hypothetical protein